jgi:hypothetical protein
VAVGTSVARLVGMTMKKLFMLGGVLAGAAYLRNKDNRDRLFGRVRDMLDKAKTSASDLGESSTSSSSSSSQSSRDNDIGSNYGSSSGYGGYDDNIGRGRAY